MDTDYNKYVVDMNEYFAKLAKEKQLKKCCNKCHTGKCMYIGTIEERKKYYEMTQLKTKKIKK